MKVLVVDDSKLIRSIVRNNLEMLKIPSNAIFEAMDGLNAIRFLSGLTDADLIITDLEMPKMNGIEFIKKVRESKKIGNIRIVACSSSLNDTNVTMLHALNVTDLIRKPFDADSFMTAIKPVIDGIMHRNDEENSDRFVDVRADFLNAFREGKPEIEVMNHNLYLKFKGIVFRTSVDNFLKDAVVSYPKPE